MQLPAKLAHPRIDLDKLRSYRLGRLRKVMAERQVDLAIITNPLSMRYVADYWNYPLFLSRIPSTILIVPVEGPIAISGAYTDRDNQFDITLPMFNLTAFDGGIEQTAEPQRFAEWVKSYIESELNGLGKQIRVGLDRTDADVFNALVDAGIRCCDVTRLVEEAKMIKSAEEVQLIRHAVAVAELGMHKMRENMIPGVTENELWSWLHQTNIAHGGYWTDGNMLASGQRTNPWLQDASHKQIQAGEIVAFDSDMVGPDCYFADVSRSWVCGDNKPTANQQELFEYAFEEVTRNIELARPGVSFREFSDKAFRQPEKYHAGRYPCVTHGVGMCDEYPKIPYFQDWSQSGYDGVIEPGMVLCIESYVGESGGKEGVKLEEQVLVTENGYERLSCVPLDLLW
ncbi:MAG: Xaa-Pro dipeptidase [Parasphingorhabdus sp.]|jgi:Xaa-Pro dipeptidase